MFLLGIRGWDSNIQSNPEILIFMWNSLIKKKYPLSQSKHTRRNLASNLESERSSGESSNKT